MKEIVIIFPGYLAVSRNDTTGHFSKYAAQLLQAERAMSVYGRDHEHHFQGPVDVTIACYFDTTHPHPSVGRTGKMRLEYINAIDAPNIDDKIFTDTLNRYKMQRVAGKTMRLERRPWFIEDDKPAYLHEVAKESHAASENKVVITITDCSHPLGR